MADVKRILPGGLRVVLSRVPMVSMVPTVLMVQLSLFLCLSGCARVPFDDHPGQPLAQFTRAQLLADCWLASGHRYLCRHSGLLEVFTRKIPLEGVIKIDTSSGEARLVAMDSMGVKLFDLTVRTDSYQLNYLLPLLDEHRQLPEMVAKSVQHIFLPPYPGLDDELHSGQKKYQLTAPGAGVSFDFVGVPLRLSAKVNKGVGGSEETWRADYYQYKKYVGAKEQLWAPSGIILEDSSGFRLTLWIQELREL